MIPRLVFIIDYIIHCDTQRRYITVRKTRLRLSKSAAEKHTKKDGFVSEKSMEDFLKMVL